MALAFIAPGQGAQFIGMGLELSKAYPLSQLTIVSSGVFYITLLLIVY